jgi:signal peptidase II
MIAAKYRLNVDRSSGQPYCVSKPSNSRVKAQRKLAVSMPSSVVPVWGPMSGLGLKIVAAIFLIDQAHKWWMLEIFRIREQGRVSSLPFLDWQYMLNTGVSFSMLDGASYSWQLTLAMFSVVVSIIMWIWLARDDTSRLLAMGLGLIVGGALGNAVDRIRLGGVADYFLPHAFGIDWPNVFNIADVAIVAGVACLLYESLVPSRKDAANPL